MMSAQLAMRLGTSNMANLVSRGAQDERKDRAKGRDTLQPYRNGGGIVSETGATSEQIERAAKEAIGNYSASAHVVGFARNAAEMWARNLVPPGERIVPAALVPTPEEVQAIRDMRSSLLANVTVFEGSPLHETISAYLERQR